VREIIKSQAEGKSIHILNNIVGKRMVLADRQMIETVLINIITNAVKFTKRGGSIKLVAKDEFNFSTVSVSDSGVGMSEEQLKHLFQIDSKHNSVGTEMESGTGLGLLICKEFIEYHQGKIWAESQTGKGSIFSFTIQNAR
jgi:two-component system sensor histidine kinase/response regulator